MSRQEARNRFVIDTGLSDVQDRTAAAMAGLSVAIKNLYDYLVEGLDAEVSEPDPQAARHLLSRLQSHYDRLGNQVSTLHRLVGILAPADDPVYEITDKGRSYLDSRMADNYIGDRIAELTSEALVEEINRTLRKIDPALVVFDEPAPRQTIRERVRGNGGIQRHY